jgi:hypothetical protein
MILERSIVMNIGCGTNVTGLVMAFERLAEVTADNTMVLYRATKAFTLFDATAGPLLRAARDREKARLQALRRATRNGRPV